MSNMKLTHLANLLLPFLVPALTIVSSAEHQSTLEESVTVLIGKPVKFSCESSFPPTWMWNSAKDATTKTLSASGTKPHPRLNEPRYHFHKQEEIYSLSISEARIGDVGKFICDGHSRLTFSLSVLRYFVASIFTVQIVVFT